MRIELHILQNFAPSNLNRDDTGSPKDAEFGGYRRARVSSQCQKRAVREYFKAHADLIPAGNLGERTRRLVEEVAKQLAAGGKPTAEAELAALAAVTAVLNKTDADKKKTPYLLFLGRQEIENFTKLVLLHWEAFSAAVVPAVTPAVVAPKPAGRGKPKPAAGPKVPDGFAKAVEKLLDGGKAVDVSLFGRMLADLPENNVHAACQVAHALGTNKLHSMEMDYYTAVDDLKPDDTAGADMIGTIEFNSSCYYRYANLDLAQLAENLQHDAPLVRKGAAAFLEAFVHAVPTGKQNSFAAHSKPSLVMAVVRSGPPVSLANAFVRPVSVDKQKYDSLVENSVKAFDAFCGRMATGYGYLDAATDGTKAVAAFAFDGGLKELKAHEQTSVAGVLSAALAAAFPAEGAQ